MSLASMGLSSCPADRRREASSKRHSILSIRWRVRWGDTASGWRAASGWPGVPAWRPAQQTK